METEDDSNGLTKETKNTAFGITEKCLEDAFQNKPPFVEQESDAPLPPARKRHPACRAQEYPTVSDFPVVRSRCNGSQRSSHHGNGTDLKQVKGNHTGEL